MIHIKLKDYSYTYPRESEPSLKNLNLEVKQGEFLAIMGPNDGGKSTLCRSLIGVIPHSIGGTVWGEVQVNGQDVFETPVATLAQDLGIVLDEPEAQLFTQTVDSEICFGLENLCWPADKIDQALTWAKEITHLEEFGDRNPMELSGGQKQRVVIASALAPRPKILVLDEPSSHLDPTGTKEIFDLLKQLQVDEGVTIVLASHNSEMVASHADRVLLLDQGKVREVGTPQQIFSHKELLGELHIDPPNHWELKTDPDPIQSIKNPFLKVEDLSYTYPSGQKALNRVSLEIHRGDFVAIVGDNGSGKSTLLKSLISLIKPDQGTISLDNRNPENWAISELAHLIGYVQQNPDRQLFSKTLWDEVAFGPKNMGITGEKLSQLVTEALESVQLTEYASEYPPALSKGNRARAVIASVLAMGSELLILDEPTEGQDNWGRRIIMDIATGLNKKGYTIIHVTHNMSLVQEYAQRIIRLDKGCIVLDNRVKK